ncbi:MAG TPA: maleylpyruvate isomerase N-terminal domain-containing protein [Longimicrobiales bacterium]
MTSRERRRSEGVGAADDTRPVATAHLFRPLSDELLALLRSLSAESWSAPTSAGRWTVRDVAAHLLDGDVRRLSAGRDGHLPPQPARGIRDYGDLLRYLNELNAEWVGAARRMSPNVLIDLLALLSPQVADVMEAADPGAPAVFGVAWAGQTESPMWLDIGRDYTERWHHQDQIREAVGAPPLDAPVWVKPGIEVSLAALPHAYRSTEAGAGTRIALSASGAGGGDWTLERAASGGWRLLEGLPEAFDCRIRMRALPLLRLLMHRLDPEQARAVMRIDGSAALAQPLLHARAVMVATA